MQVVKTMALALAIIAAIGMVLSGIFGVCHLSIFSALKATLSYALIGSGIFVLAAAIALKILAHYWCKKTEQETPDSIPPPIEGTKPKPPTPLVGSDPASSEHSLQKPPEKPAAPKPQEFKPAAPVNKPTETAAKPTEVIVPVDVKPPAIITPISKPTELKPEPPSEPAVVKTPEVVKHAENIPPVITSPVSKPAAPDKPPEPKSNKIIFGKAPALHEELKSEPPSNTAAVKPPEVVKAADERPQVITSPIPDSVKPPEAKSKNRLILDEPELPLNKPPELKPAAIVDLSPPLQSAPTITFEEMKKRRADEVTYTDPTEKKVAIPSDLPGLEEAKKTLKEETSRFGNQRQAKIFFEAQLDYAGRIILGTYSIDTKTKGIEHPGQWESVKSFFLDRITHYNKSLEDKFKITEQQFAEPFKELERVLSLWSTLLALSEKWVLENEDLDKLEQFANQLPLIGSQVYKDFPILLTRLQETPNKFRTIIVKSENKEKAKTIINLCCATLNVLPGFTLLTPDEFVENETKRFSVRLIKDIDSLFANQEILIGKTPMRTEDIRNYMDSEIEQFNTMMEFFTKAYPSIAWKFKQISRTAVNNLKQLVECWEALEMVFRENLYLDEKIKFLCSAAENLPDADNPVWTDFPNIHKGIIQATTGQLLKGAFFSNRVLFADSISDRQKEGSIQIAMDLITDKTKQARISMAKENDTSNDELLAAAVDDEEKMKRAQQERADEEMARNLQNSGHNSSRTINSSRFGSRPKSDAELAAELQEKEYERSRRFF